MVAACERARDRSLSFFSRALPVSRTNSRDVCGIWTVRLSTHGRRRSNHNGWLPAQEHGQPGLKNFCNMRRKFKGLGAIKSTWRCWHGTEALCGWDTMLEPSSSPKTWYTESPHPGSLIPLWRATSERSSGKQFKHNASTNLPEALCG